MQAEMWARSPCLTSCPHPNPLQTCNVFAATSNDTLWYPWAAHRNNWVLDGTLGAHKEIRGLLKASIGLSTVIFAFTKLVVDSAVVPSCRRCTPFEACSIMLYHVPFTQQCWGESTVLAVQVAQQDFSVGSEWMCSCTSAFTCAFLWSSILVAVIKVITQRQTIERRSRKNTNFLGRSIPVWSLKKPDHLPRNDGRAASATHITEANKAKRSGMVSTSQMANKRTFSEPRISDREANNWPDQIQCYLFSWPQGIIWNGPPKYGKVHPTSAIKFWETHNS